MSDPGEELTEYNGVTMKVKDIPDAAIRVLMGVGHGVGKPPYDGWRDVVPVPGRVWESTPDVCTYGSFNWEWVDILGPDGGTDVSYLVCPKCGLNGT